MSSFSCHVSRKSPEPEKALQAALATVNCKIQELPSQEWIRVRTARQSAESVSPGKTKEEAMKKQKMPKGWTQKPIRELADFHDRQTQEEQAKEIEDAIAAKDRTLMVVPTKLVPEIQALISRKLGA